MPIPFNGSTKTVLGVGGILLTLGAGYGVLQSKVNELDRRLTITEQQIEIRSDNPQATAVGSMLQQEFTDVDKRLTRIEAKQDQLLTILQDNSRVLHAH